MDNINIFSENIKNRKNKRVLVAMSGGVDSSVAASLLVDQGYDVIGMTMQVWDYSHCDIDEGNGTCCSSVDVEDARAVADVLKIPFYVANCEAYFKERVIDPFVSSYLQGKTPNPCVNCNTFLKFDHLIHKMMELDCDYLATGHYAQIVWRDRRAFIVTSEDSWKDQTYFLFTIDSKVVPRLLFPVGDRPKDQVRDYAESRGLLTARKKDSTGICFVGNQSYGDFIKSYASQLLPPVGSFRLYPSGEILGQHSGIHHFTYGQRRGLGLDYHETLFVLKIDSASNTVWIGNESHLYADQLILTDVNWLDEHIDNERVRVKIRFHHQGAWAKLRSCDGSQVRVEFEQPQRAITPGQAAVIYRGQQLVGGGWII